MKPLTLHIYIKNMLTLLLLLIVFMLLTYRYRISYAIIEASSIFVFLLQILHGWILLPSLSLVQSPKRALVTGIFNGLVLSLAARVGIAINWILWSSKREIDWSDIFTGVWWLYFAMMFTGIIVEVIGRHIKRSGTKE